MTRTREYALSKPEYRRLVRRLTARRWTPWLALLWALVGYSVFSAFPALSSPGFGRALASAAPLILMALALTLWALWVAPALMARSKQARSTYLRQTTTFTDAALQVDAADGSRISRPYTAIERFEETDEMLLLFQDTGFVFAVPHRAFADDAQRAAVIDAVRARMTSTTADGSIVTPPYSMGSGLKRNLAAGLRLLALRRTAPDTFAIHGDQLLLLTALALGLYITGEYLRLEGPLEFSPYGLDSHLAATLVLIAGAYLVTRFLGTPDRFLAFAVPLMSIEPWFALVYGVIEATGAWRVSDGLLNAGRILGLLWYLLALARVAQASLPERSGRVPVAVAVILAASLLPSWWMPHADFWYSLDPEDEGPEVNVEDIYYAQPGMISAAVDALSPQRPGVVDLYHIGFGSYAHQGVFRREVGHVKDILDRGFDTAGRSLALINHQDTLPDVPIASRSNLRLALEGLGQRMDPEEDVLLLYLTSHGSRDATLSVDFWPLQLNELTAGDLRAMLDASGIRWRVVVVSACFAGTFVDALKDDHTVVIAAAAPDRNSFGCANENEYTYFGEAYFRDALARTPSFIEAFDHARDSIARRESDENRKPSKPMIYVGDAAREHLQRLEQRLAALPVPAG